MTNPIIAIALIIIGSFVGYLISKVFEKLKKEEVPFLGISWLQFFAETFYFSLLLSAPISGNLVVSMLLIAIFGYTLYGTYVKQIKPKRAEDEVESKWFPKFP